jgi:hypothetical protein
MTQEKTMPHPMRIPVNGTGSVIDPEPATTASEPTHQPKYPKGTLLGLPVSKIVVATLDEKKIPAEAHHKLYQGG